MGEASPHAERGRPWDQRTSGVAPASPRSAFSYDVFISYSHAADGLLAPAVQRAFERLAVPWYAPQRCRVFRDQTGLELSEALWPSIQQALESSRAFVLLASPEAAVSPWVQREVESRISAGGPILLVLTEGDIVWNDSTADFDRVRTTALPAELLGYFAQEPLWLDLRWAKGETDLSLRNPRFSDAIATLVAPVRGVEKGELSSDLVRQARQVRVTVTGVVATLLVLTVAAVLFALQAARNEALAVENAAEARRNERLANESGKRADESAREAGRNAVEARRAAEEAEANATLARDNAKRAEDNRALAEERAREAAARSVAIAARRMSESEQRPNLALLLAVEAEHVQPGLGAIAAFETLLDSPKLDRYLRSGGPSVTGLTYDASSGRLYWLDDDGVHQWQPGQAASKTQGDAFVAHHSVFEAEGVTLTSTLSDVAVAPGARLAAQVVYEGVALWRLGSHENVGTIAIPQEPQVTALALSHDGSVLATGHEDRSIRLWDVQQGRLRATLAAAHSPDERDSGILALAFSPTGTELTSLASDDTPVHWDLAQNPITWSSPGRLDATVHGLRYSADGGLLLAYGAGVVLLGRGSRASRSYLYGAHLSVVHDAVQLPNGRVVSAGDDGSIVLWDPGEQRGPRRPLPRHRTSVVATWLDADGRTGITIDWDHRIARWQLRPELEFLHGVDLPTEGGTIQVHPNGRSVVVGAEDGRVLLVDIPEGHVQTIATLESDVSYIEVAGDGQSVAAASFKGTVGVWPLSPNASGGTTLQQAGSTALGIDYRGQRVAIGLDSGDIVVWHPKSGRTQTIGDAHEQRVRAVAFSPNGQVLASGGADHGVRVYFGKNYRKGPAQKKHSGDVWELHFSGDSRFLFSSGLDALLLRWPVRHMSDPLVLTGHGGAIGSIASARNGRDLLSGDGHMLALSWNLEEYLWLEMSCQVANSVITREQWRRHLPAREYDPACRRGVLRLDKVSSNAADQDVH